jgi:hypothetical protein
VHSPHRRPAGSPPSSCSRPTACRTAAAGDGEQASINATAGAFAANIRLFMPRSATGSTTATSRPWQRRCRRAGRSAERPPFFVAHAAIKTAFAWIIGGVTSCELTINGTIDETQAAGGTVTLNGMPLQFGVDWELVNGNVIRLLGQACTDLKNSPNPMVQASFPCGAVIL